MRSPQILLGIAVLGLIGVGIGVGVTEGPRAALTPVGSAIVFGAVLYKSVRTQPEPTPWTRSRIILGAVLFGTAGLAVILAMVRVLTVRSEWAIRIVAVIGILSVPALGLWLVRVARAQDRLARSRGAAPSGE